MIMMTYEEARAYMTEIGKTGSIPGLLSIRNLMDELGNVQKELSVLHIAGTNGKGSVGAFLESALLEAGRHVGRYTSPAVFSPLEVWRVDNREMTEEEYAGYTAKIKEACDRMKDRGLMHPTVFEAETEMAFLFFYDKNCDYVLLETGMGGAEDATNLIERPVCSLITSISMDHMQFLGNSLEEIAAAKAGIIKEGCPAATIRQKEPVMRILEAEAEKKGVRLIVAEDTERCFEGSRFRYNGIGTAELSMAGLYQLENSHLAAVVLKEVLRLPNETILKGISGAKWPGRFEIVSKDPLFLLDGAHNEDAAKMLAASLENYFTNCKITYIIGVLKDKEYKQMLKILLPYAARVYAVTPPNHRALDKELLLEEALKYVSEAEACESVAKAVSLARESAGNKGVIVACGSLSYFGELKQALSLVENSGGRKTADRKDLRFGD